MGENQVVVIEQSGNEGNACNHDSMHFPLHDDFLGETKSFPMVMMLDSIDFIECIVMQAFAHIKLKFSTSRLEKN